MSSLWWRCLPPIRQWHLPRWSGVRLRVIRAAERVGRWKVMGRRRPHCRRLRRRQWRVRPLPPPLPPPSQPHAIICRSSCPLRHAVSSPPCGHSLASPHGLDRPRRPSREDREGRAPPPSIRHTSGGVQRRRKREGRAQQAGGVGRPRQFDLWRRMGVAAKGGAPPPLVGCLPETSFSAARFLLRADRRVLRVAVGVVWIALR